MSEHEAWSEPMAIELVTSTIAAVETEHGERSYDRRELTRFNHAIASAHEARSMAALRSACAAYVEAVHERLAKSGGEAT